MKKWISLFLTLMLALAVAAPAAAADTAVIGGADGPTAIITASSPLSPLAVCLEICVPLILFIVCVILAVKVWRLEKKLK